MEPCPRALRRRRGDRAEASVRFGALVGILNERLGPPSRSVITPMHKVTKLC
jgi:hypothetical protein